MKTKTALGRPAKQNDVSIKSCSFGNRMKDDPV